ncbi:hypothetical protein L207DRAFT_303332 [Hyaloscypha variabilis F]|uniref:Uncharacterized protein n=1 Tax=Hyaloscypha variabilis (strain UAMH 11265 / GT02V1 / F) TaxID=1149755 RepID=A0A2J6RZ35_HYAVF|nr:hypothetical protein L207DRAFT_303332 [Hyaloscypha variabilis F]
MASSADIVASMRSLDLSPSPNPSKPKTELTKAKTKTTNSQPKLKPQPAKTNPINVPNEPSKSQSSKSQPPKSQPKFPPVYPVYTPLRPLPKIDGKANGGKTYQFQARAEPGAVPASSKKIKRSPRNYIKRSNSAASATQAGVSTAPMSSQPLSSPVQPKPQATSPLQQLTEEFPQQTFRYVVQVSGDSETVIGVHSELERANECAKGYVGRWGVGKSEIVDIQSSFGYRSRVVRRSWKYGISDIRVGGAWVRVLPKEFIASEEGDNKMYLAVDRSGGGLFVIGIFAQKEPAWEACKKYRDQLAYCFELEEKEQWFDGEGMFHSKGRIGDQGHHWFVVEYPLDGMVE